MINLFKLSNGIKNKIKLYNILLVTDINDFN